MSLSFISFGLSFRRLRCFFESCDLYWTLGRPFSIGGLVSILSSLDCSDQFLEDNFNAKELQAPCWRRCYPQSHPRVFFRLERVKSWTNSIWSQRIMGYIYIYIWWCCWEKRSQVSCVHLDKLLIGRLEPARQSSILGGRNLWLVGIWNIPISAGC